MKIGIFISPRSKVPPDEDIILAPWSMAAELTNGLVDKKHDVYLFAAQGSNTEAKLHDFSIKEYPHKHGAYSQYDWESIKRNDQLLFSGMLETAVKESIQILHVHQLEFINEIIISATSRLNFVFTLHDPISQDKYNIMKLLSECSSSNFVSISNSQRGNLPLNFIDTVYNGIDIKNFPFTEEASDYLLFMGRIRKEKGLHNAIKVATDLNLQLEIGAPLINIAPTNAYFHKEIKPYLNSKYIGQPGFLKGKNKQILYQEARVLLFPIEWEEPFGLVMVEAMACGTPVIAFGRGSVPEIVKDGITGFIIEPDGLSSSNPKTGKLRIRKKGIEGLKEAVNMIYNMPGDEYKKMRLACRKQVEDKFTVQRMVDGYIKVYEKVLGIK